jgi:hypothetical protein
MPEASSVLSSGDPEPQQQVYEAESSQEYFKREEDGKVLEEVREAQQREKPLDFLESNGYYMYHINNLHFARSVCFCSNYFRKRHKLISACNGDGLCLV